MFSLKYIIFDFDSYTYIIFILLYFFKFYCLTLSLNINNLTNNIQFWQIFNIQQEPSYELKWWKKYYLHICISFSNFSN